MNFMEIISIFAEILTVPDKTSRYFPREEKHKLIEMKRKGADIGKWGEDLTVELLVAKGYAIRETNWRMPPLEIDIIAIKGNRLVFVEVKTRTEGEFDPVLAINRKKQSNMIRAANAYVNIHNLPHEVQFDVVLIVGTPDAGYTIDHLEDAFYPSLKRY